MAKQSKRSRKFQASGGVAARLKKGTVTKKGKLQKRSSGGGPTSTSNATATKASNDEKMALSRRDRSDDLVAPKNVGALDLDSFFAQVANTLEGGGDDDHAQLQEPVELSDNDNDDDVNDEASSSSEEEAQKSKTQTKDTKTRKKKSKQQMEQDDEVDSPSSASDDASSSDDDSDDDDDDDDDDDIDAAEARMKKEMARLTEKDPEFHEFLQEHEQDLLEFGQDQGDDEEEEDEDEDEDQDEDQMQAEMDDEDGDGGGMKKKDMSSSSSSGTTLTMVLLDKLRRGTFESHGIKALKKLVAAYRSACYLSDASSAASSAKGARTYAIESPAVFDSLMVLCLSRCHKIFRYHLLGGEKESKSKKDENKGESENAVDPDQPIQPHKLENADKWESIQPILQSFLRSTIHLLNESKEPNLLAFITKALAHYLPLMTPFPRLAEALLKTTVNMWSAAADTSADYQVVRLQAFFRIRQLALTQPFPFSETVLKKTYLAYAARAAFGTASSLATTLPTLTFMGNCLVELYGLDYHSSYQHAFVYIRQLALQLRAAVQKKTPESFQQVYSQQYMHCLKLWTAVLAHATSKEDEEPDAKIMRSLLYPLSEIILGTARTAPSPVRLFPLRLQCIRLLQQLAASAQVYLPTTSLLLDCFDWKEWYAKPKKATKRNTLRGGLPLYMLLKLPKEDPLRTHEQLEAALVQIILCLEREMELYRYTAAFPEFRVRIRQRCRDFIKLVRPSRWKAYARSCIEKSDQYAAFVTQERAKLAQAPKDIPVLECLRPSHIPTMQERHQQAMDEESKSAKSILAAAASASQSKKRKSADEADDDDDEDEEHTDGNASDDEEKAKEEQESSKSKKKKNKKKAKKAKVVDSEEVMGQEDEVVEGVDWLD